MKKLLTILALALALCMLCSVAMAATNYSGKFESEDEFNNAKNNGYILNVRVQESDIEAVKKTHTTAEYAVVRAKGDKMAEHWEWVADDEGDHYTYSDPFDEENGYYDGRWVWETWEDEDGNKMPEDATYVSYQWIEDVVEQENVGIEVLVNVHNKDGQPKEVKATCTTDGYVAATCKACGYVWAVEDDDKTDKTGHSWYWKTIKEATCATDGSMQKTCSVCGATDGDPVVIEATGWHDWQNDWDNILYLPSCASNDQNVGHGLTTVVCATCGAKENWTKDFWIWDYQNYLRDKGDFAAADQFDGHTWDAWKDADKATCLANATQKRWCKVCNKIEYREVENTQLNHEFVAADVTCEIAEGDEIEFTCRLCKTTKTYYRVTSDDVDTLNEKGAVVLGLSDGTGAFNAKTVVSHTMEAPKDSKDYYYDEDDNVVEIGKDTKVPCEAVTYHKYVCKVCGFEQEKKVGTKAHEYTEWVKIEDAAGETARWERHCKNCDKIEVKASTDTPVVCAPGAHKYELLHPEEYNNWGCGETIEDAELICSVCGDQTKGEYKLPKHNFEDIAVLTAATCTTAGEVLQKCTRCDYIHFKDVPALQHKGTDGKLALKAIEEVKATCKTTGTKAAYECTLCGKLFEDKDATKAIDALVVIPVDETAHVWDKGVVTTEATTEKEGVKTYTCSVCGKTKTEAIAKLVPDTEFTASIDFDKDEMTLTGKATQKEGTKEVKNVYARVTYFMADGTYVVVSVPVEADGTFESMNSGNVIHVSVQIVDSAKVRPGEFTRFGGSEKDVK